MVRNAHPFYLLLLPYLVRLVPEISSARRRPLHDRRVPPSPLITDDTYVAADLNADSPIQTNPNTTFPPPPNPNAPPLSSSPTSAASRAASNALSRALTLASKKLFGVSSSSRRSHHREYSASSPRRQQIIAGRGLDEDGERDPLEDELLAILEELAQKTDVLTHWADEMYEYVKAVPQSISRHSFSPHHIDYLSVSSEPLPDPNKFAKREGEAEKHAIRRKNADMEAEYNAVTCVAVYMLLMSFSQKGIDKLRNHQEHMKMRNPDGEFVVSEGFDDGNFTSLCLAARQLMGKMIFF
jgi:serine/threonine-protein kinase ULK2